MTDPPRLRDDPAAPELARELRRAQGDVLSPEAVARVQGALRAAGVATTGAAAAGALGAAASPKPLSRLFGAAMRLRIGLAVVGLAVGVAGASRWVRRAEGVLPSSSTQPEAVTPEPVVAVPVPAAPSDRAEVPPSAPSAATPPEADSPAGAPAPSAKTARPPRIGAHPAGAGGVPSPREGALLLEARRMLDAQPARALALVRTHEQEFPESQLAPERARIAAEAGRRLGR